MKRLLLYAALLLLTQCSKCKQEDPSPESQLPPSTQTGANTFGCLVNGQPWTPKGGDGTANYTVSYDAAYRKGTLNIYTYRITGTTAYTYQSITLFSDSLTRTGIYSLTIAGHQEGLFSDLSTGCKFHGNAPHYRRGNLTITRLDLQAGIIAGTFAFTLYKPGCDSIRVTNGRFDKQL
ncbi:hypothetical protein LGH70_13310 [Hymenobacter sp. BT635]|uniref:Lipoprotein n=1 Tax=Hymenobacter nitidus TaxID=2880929 RepID=A0ABS8ADW5_9BACT|nr:hypothetical protein [Hymenobacter nitidus]MCB2378572.1 hypothetical protein [Hymenobacter nitidus]